MSSINNIVVICVILVTIFVINTNAYPSDDLSSDLEYIKICNMTSPISLRTMNEFLISKKLSKKESSSFKCFLHCLFTKYGWMDEEGGFLLHEIKKVLEDSEVEIASLEYIIYKCTALGSVDKCERSFMFTQCFWKKMTEQSKSDEQLFYSLAEK